MKSIHTTTLTSRAEKRGIIIEVIDEETPIFIMKHGNKSIRCYNGLTDHVGAVSFHLANNKVLANRFLAANGFNVPAQTNHYSWEQSVAFLKKWKQVVVKPVSEWGARGVTIDVKTEDELRAGLRLATCFGEGALIEQQVTGVDHRLIFVDRKFTAAITRTQAFVTGNGKDSVRSLIKAKNKITTAVDPGHKIPLDAETARALASIGRSYDSVPDARKKLTVRYSSNYHPGGYCLVVTDTTDSRLIEVGERVAALYDVPLIGVD
ncbi:MAG: hypothetical protein GX811_03355, partial [Lentisphaerae bacterium]|nr:hypothetical protein [Lentisphaerota bacterium]